VGRSCSDLIEKARQALSYSLSAFLSAFDKKVIAEVFEECETDNLSIKGRHIVRAMLQGGDD